jgi:hypothetical protein
MGSNLKTESHFPVLNFVVLWLNIFSTFVDQVKRLLALSCRQFEAVRHKFNCKRLFKRHLVKGLKVIAPEIPYEQPTKEITVGLANS